MVDISMLPTAGQKPWDVDLNQAITNLAVAVENTIGIPAGGTDDQVLIKASASDYDAEWSTLAGSGLVPDSSTTTKGIVELATTGETTTGTDTVRAVTPAGVKAVTDALIVDATTSVKGIVELATTGEATTGTDTVRAVTPAGLKAATDVLNGEAAVNTVGATGSTETLSAAYQLHKITMDQNCTFTFTSPTAGACFAVLLSGAFTATWPASVKWPDGTLPTYSAPSLYVFATFDGGTTWEGVQSGKAFA